MAGETANEAAAALSDTRSDCEHELTAASQSELGVSVQIHSGPSFGSRSWRTRTHSKEGRMNPQPFTTGVGNAA
jgi:hypothetical protein